MREQGLKNRRNFISIRHQLLAVLFLATIPLLVAFMLFDYNKEKKALINIDAQLKQQTEQYVEDSIILIDAGFKALEKRLEENMRNQFQAFEIEYQKAGRDPSAMDLQELKRALGDHADLYIINDKGIIEYSTIQEDVGIDFNKWGMGSFIEMVRNSGDFYSSRVDPSFVSGVLKKFSYIASSDGKYVFEIGEGINRYLDNDNKLDMFRAAEEFKGLNLSLEEVVLYNREGFVMGQPEKRADGETMKIIKSLFDGKGRIEIRRGARSLAYRLVDLNDPRYGTNPSLVVELTYNNLLLKVAERKMLASYFLFSLVFVLLGIILAFFYSALVSRPILYLSAEVEKISSGKKPERMKSRVTNELSVLGDRIVEMAAEVERKTEELMDINASLEIEIEERRRTEEMLMESESRMRTILNNAPALIYLKDANGKYRFVNKKFEEVFNIKNDDIVGKTAKDIFPAGAAEEYKRRDCAVAVAGRALETEQEIIQNDGVHTFLSSKFPIYDLGGKLVFICGIATDITERKMSEEALVEEKAKIESIISTMTDGLTIRDLNYNVIFQNDVIRKLFGNALGKKCYSAFEGSDEICEDCPVEKAFRDGETHVSMREIVAPDGRKMYWENTATPIRDSEGYISSCLEISKDVTDRVTLEKQKRKIQEEEKYALIGKVAGKMAHDFNNVLGITLGTADLLMDQELHPEIKDDVEALRQCALRGREITRNLLLFSSSKELKYTSFDLNARLRAILKAMEQGVRNIDVSTNYGEGLERIVADAGLLENAIINLIQNAIHAVSKTERPRVEIKTEKISNKLIFEITDNGCGISKENQEKIFEPLFSLKGDRDVGAAYDKRIKGSGYGLANVKMAVDKHGGEIFLRSEVGKGSTFRIEIPAMEADSKKENKKEVNPGIEGGLVGKKALVVEDEGRFSAILSRILTQAGIEVSIATDGETAIEMFNANSYDVVSMDFQLPGKSGFEVYKEIRERNEFIPIIFVSGNFEFNESINEITKSDKYMDHMAKPFDNADYLKKISEWLLGRVAS